MASLGITAFEPAQVPSGPGAVDELLQAADRNLYASKRGEVHGLD
jgi:hypothetical protein